MSSPECYGDAWPEDLPPSGPLPCDSCSLTESGSRVVWGEGNPEADVWILLDNPGMRGDYILLATYHPLAVRRRPNWESHWRNDWCLLRNEYVRDCYI